MRLSQRDLIGMGKVDVVQRQGHHGERVRLGAEGVLQCRHLGCALNELVDRGAMRPNRPEAGPRSRTEQTYQDGLAGALYAIEPQKERRGITVGIGMPLGMDAQSLQKKRNTMLRLVVHDFWHVGSFFRTIGYGGQQVLRSGGIWGF